MAIQLLIADDHEAVREGLRSLLASRPDFAVCGEARDGVEAIAQCKFLLPDVVLMDISMPRMNGLAASRAILRELPDTKIIIVSQNDLTIVNAQAKDVGAAGFVSKANLARELIPTIDEVVNGAENKATMSSSATTNPALDWIKGEGEMATL